MKTLKDLTQLEKVIFFLMRDGKADSKDLVAELVELRKEEVANQKALAEQAAASAAESQPPQEDVSHESDASRS